MQSVYTVAQVNAYVKNMFAQDYLMQSLLVRGEVSNCKYHSSGHIYFTLKDASGVIACVMFASSRSGLSFRLEEGMQVIVGGSIAVFERDGKYQLYAKKITADGAGDLHVRFEQLKKELEERGMFDAMFKQPIPKFVRTLGVVTAPTGAAVQDIINITTRRNPLVQIVLYPAIVQGEKAKESIVRGIQALEKQNVDVIIVGRGGGSLEDLWAFNEPEVAQAIFDCHIPIISAVGHETDTTIADFVADLRAPTPSAAAELAVYERSQIIAELGSYQEKLTGAMDEKIRRVRESLERRQLLLKSLSPQNKLREKRMLAMKLEESLQEAMQVKMQTKKHRFEVLLERMKGLSPLNRMSKGFAYVSDESGKGIMKAEALKKGQKIKMRFSDGMVKAEVEEVIMEGTNG